MIDNLSHRSLRLGSRLTVNSVIILCILVYGLTSHIRYKIGGFLDFKSIVLLMLFTVCLAKMVITGRINNLRNNKIVLLLFFIFSLRLLPQSNRTWYKLFLCLAYLLACYVSICDQKLIPCEFRLVLSI